MYANVCICSEKDLGGNRTNGSRARSFTWPLGSRFGRRRTVTATHQKMAIALAILVAFLVLEATVGILINSLALLADAGHMLTDVVGMAMGLTALLLAKRGSTTAARTFGWHRAEVLTAMANAVMLLAVAAWVFYEAIGRIGNEPEIPGAP